MGTDTQPEPTTAATTPAPVIPQGLPASPYPGLRPFRRNEAPVFFGRSKERIALLELLEERSFLAVLGSSGSGKSSLVLSGLIPDIASGKLLTESPTRFAFADFRPGGNPYAAVARAIAEKALPELKSDPFFLEERLRQSRFGLVRLLEEIWSTSKTETGEEQAAANESSEQRGLVLVADQFEEIFRFAGLTRTTAAQKEATAANRDFAPIAGELNEAQAFVDLLLASAESRNVPIHVVLTMRSDFYKHCELFDGLPEMMAANQFLTPRMTRRQIEDAIRMPIRPYGWSIEDAAVNWILNDIQGEFDQLPLLQHLLAEMWRGAVDAKDRERVLTTADYEKAGKLSGALDAHGDELIVATKLPETCVERVFRCLGDFDRASGEAIRRPRTVAQVVAESGLTEAEVIGVANCFRETGASFLMPPRSEELDTNTILDLSHECLLRKWTKLTSWMNKERQMGRNMARLQERATDLEWNPKFNTNKGALSYIEVGRFTEAFPSKADLPPLGWGPRYEVDVDSLTRFLLKQQRSLQFRRIGILAIAMLLIGGGLWVWRSSKEAERLSQEAKLSKAQLEKEQARRKTLETEAELTAAQREAQKRQEEATAEANRTLIASQSDNLARISALEDGARSLVALLPPASLDAKMRASLEQIGLIEKPQITAVGPQMDTRARQPVTLGEYGKGVGAVAWRDAGTPKATLLVGADNLYAQSFLEGGAEQRPGKPVWTQTAATIAVSNLPDSAGWAVAANGSDDITWCGEGGAWTARKTGMNAVVRARFVPGRRILLATANGKLGLLNTAGAPDEKARVFNTPHMKTINDVVLNRSGDRFVASGDDNKATLWSLTEDGIQQVDKPVECGAPVRSASFSPDGKWLLLPSGEKTIRYMRLARGAAPITDSTTFLLNHERPVVSGAISPNGRWILTADTAGAIYVWRADASRLVNGVMEPPTVARGHRGRVTALSWSPTGNGWASVDIQGTVLLWRLKDGANVSASPVPMTPHRGTVDTIAWMPDGTAFATGSADKTARIHPTRVITRGGYKVFGGESSGEYGSEMALIERGDIGAPQFAALFRKAVPAEKGLVAALETNAAYLASRWDYGTTPRDYLRAIKVKVSNPSTGKFEFAQPIDWGPHPKTGKAVDLSPGLETRLKLTQPNEVEIEVPLLETAEPGDVFTVQIARRIIEWEGGLDAGKPIPAKLQELLVKLAVVPEVDDATGTPDELLSAALAAVIRESDAASGYADHPGIIAFLRDSIIAVGPKKATQLLQQATGSAPDGMLGARTIASMTALESRSPEALLDKLADARRAATNSARPEAIKRIEQAREYARALLYAKEQAVAPNSPAQKTY